MDLYYIANQLKAARQHHKTGQYLLAVEAYQLAQDHMMQAGYPHSDLAEIIEGGREMAEYHHWQQLNQNGQHDAP